MTARNQRRKACPGGGPAEPSLCARGAWLSARSTPARLSPAGTMGQRRAGARGQSGGASRPMHVQGHLCGTPPPTWLEHPRVGTLPTHPLIAPARRVCKSLEQDAARSGFAPGKPGSAALLDTTLLGLSFPAGKGPRHPPATPIPPSPRPGRLGYSPGISPPWSSHPAGPWGAAGAGQGCGGAGARALHLPRPQSSRSPWGLRPAAPRAPAARPGPVRPRALPGRPGRDCSCVRNGALSRAGEKGWLPHSHSGPGFPGPGAGPNMWFFFFWDHQVSRLEPMVTEGKLRPKRLSLISLGVWGLHPTALFVDSWLCAQETQWGVRD